MPFSLAFSSAFAHVVSATPPSPIVPEPTVANATLSSDPEYAFILLDPRTLASRGELDPTVVSGSWTRRDIGPGSFSLTIPRTSISDLSSVAPHTVIMITREGALEFTGVIETRRMNKIASSWVLSGPDLLGFWLSQRVVGLVNSDNQTGIAEDLIISYMNYQLGATALPERRANNALIGISFIVDPSSGRGPVVTYEVIRKNLAEVVEELCREADLLPAIIIDSAGYRFTLTTPTDATIDSGTVPFGVDWDNVEGLEFISSFAEFKNSITVLGVGAGGAREYTTVSDSDSKFTHFLREGVTDARYATTEAARQVVGEHEIQKREAALVAVKAIPLRASATSVYRRDWNVGWDITFHEQDLRAEAINIRIVACTVELSRSQGERITFELGQRRASSMLRLLEDAIRHLRISSVE